MGLERRSSSRSDTGTGAHRFVACVRNAGYAASLEVRKIYLVVPDEDAERQGQLRVIDESGEDYLFAAERFVGIDVPAAVRDALLKAS
jgi:hypothetical protein